MPFIKSKNIPVFSRYTVQNSINIPKIIPEESNESLLKKIMEYNNMNKAIDNIIENAPYVNDREVVRA